MGDLYAWSVEDKGVRSVAQSKGVGDPFLRQLHEV